MTDDKSVIGVIAFELVTDKEIPMGYLVRVSKTGVWRVIYQDWRTNRPKEVPKQAHIKKEKLVTLGINPTDTVERVREICRHLNDKEKLEKQTERSRIRMLARQKNEDLVESAFLPVLIARDFEEKVLLKRFSGSEKALKFKKLLSHWKAVQILIAKLQVEPKNYAEECYQIYRYFAEQKFSPAYVTKLLRILNAWGQFYTKSLGGTGIEGISAPKGKSYQDIARAYAHKQNFKGPSDPLTPDMLQKAESKLIPENYRWLYLSVWLGLRPEEVEGLKMADMWKIDRGGEVPVLWVYQTKLVSIDEDKAWKPIPLIHPNQLKCLEILISKGFRKPLNKVLRKVWPESRITTYSGRKAFTDLMLGFGQSLEDISIWMGHTNISTTWKYYKQKQIVSFKKLKAS